MNIPPIYIETFKSGRLASKRKAAYETLRFCTLCPRKCGVDRLSEATGICRTGHKALVSSCNPHFGEEAPLVGRHGSGTIFFTHCNLRCTFCQNYEISHEGCGEEVTGDELAQAMLALQEAGCHNINFVTPSHVVPQILSALETAVPSGLNVPLVYNTSLYDSVDTIRLLEGVFDIYMPDFKFWDPAVAEKTCRAKDYPEVARKALEEMHRQVGDLIIDDSGIARRGLLIRHLVLPNGLAGTPQVMRFIADRISTGSYVNIMSQYRPCGRAWEIPELSAAPARKEYEAALLAAKEAGITRLDRPRRAFALR
ncbi:MAG: radical SAM protein [Desulfobacteraceae bacterium]|nr:MAG: radical SAM protein [Desulfobacteraceae bacterium]